MSSSGRSSGPRARFVSCRRERARGRIDLRCLDTASHDEFLAGRGDRMGRDLVVDVGPGAVASRSLPGAISLPPAAGLRPVLSRLLSVEPDLVWIDGVPPSVLDGCHPGSLLIHVLALARASWRAGAQVVVLVDVEQGSW